MSMKGIAEALETVRTVAFLAELLFYIAKNHPEILEEFNKQRGGKG